MTTYRYLDRRLHPQFEWACEAGILTTEEAHRLQAIPPWETPTDEDAALVRQYLHWLRTIDTRQ